ncbi:MAG: (Fe-S)-binding protein [Thermodesulfobacteriota bacterium]
MKKSLTDEFTQKCNNCGKCEQYCIFLENHGSPLQILSSGDYQEKAYLCTLCGLCSKVCPLGLNPGNLFHSLRQTNYNKGHNLYKTHKKFLNFEKFGYSGLLTFYNLPHGCRTVFFPGCNISGANSKTVLNIYKELKKNEKSTGIILDCCGTPSYSLGIIDEHKKKFAATADLLRSKKINKVYLACPNCFSIFKKFAPELNPVMITSFFKEKGYSLKENFSGEKITIHDPCVLRDKNKVHREVRELISCSGIEIKETENSKRLALCCGGGGGVSCFAPKEAKKWKNKILDNFPKHKIITYCAGCQQSLGSRSFHILDLLFNNKKDIKNSKSPITYLKRYLLKKKLLKKSNATDYKGFRYQNCIINEKEK